MGTWGSGLYDNDTALDNHHDLTTEPPGALPLDELAVYVGMRLKFGEHAPEELAAHVERRMREIDRLPDAVCAALEAFVKDPTGTAEGASRPDVHRAIVGGYQDGPRLDALVTHAPGRPVLERVVERCTEMLDASWGDLYEAAGDLVALGLLVELEGLGVEVEPDLIEEFRHAYLAAAEATPGLGAEDDGDGSFWQEYDGQVKRAFAHLLGEDLEASEGDS